MKPNKILVIQIKQLGDVLVCTPAVRAIKKQYPEAEIHFLTQNPANQMLAHNPYIHKLWKYPKDSPVKETFKLAMELRRENFDWVIDYFNKPVSATITWLTGAKVRLGYNKKGRRWAYTHPTTPKAQTLYSADERTALLAPLGITSEDLTLDFPITEADRTEAKRLLKQLGHNPSKPLITLSPVSRRAFRTWSPERFAQAANQIIKESGGQLLFLWGPGEESFIEPIRPLLDQPDLGDYAPPSLAVMAGIFEQASLHFGNDNGPMHIAVSARCLSVTVIGQSVIGNWVPTGNPRHQGVEYDPGCKLDCTWPSCQVECMDVDPKAVAKKALEMLDADRQKT